MILRDKIIKDILSDPELMEKYSIKKTDIEDLKITGPYHKKIIDVIATIIIENDNNLSESQIYKRLKNIHKI